MKSKIDLMIEQCDMECGIGNMLFNWMTEFDRPINEFLAVQSWLKEQNLSGALGIDWFTAAVEEYFKTGKISKLEDWA